MPRPALSSALTSCAVVSFVVKAQSQRRTPSYSNQYVFRRSDAASNRDFEPGFEGPSGRRSLDLHVLRVLFLPVTANYLPVIAKSSPCYRPVAPAPPIFLKLLLLNEFSCKNRSGDRQFSLFPARYQGVSGRRAPLQPELDAAEFASRQARMEPRRLEMCECGSFQLGGASARPNDTNRRDQDDGMRPWPIAAARAEARNVSMASQPAITLVAFAMRTLTGLRHLTTSLLILFVASIWAGAQNALAGGGSFITLPSLMLTGMDARAANITSTVALFPAQLLTGFTGRSHSRSPPGLSFPVLFVICLVGGALGALILLWTPPGVFAKLVPWLVLFATALFAWGSFFRNAPQPGEAHLPPWGAAVVQFFIAIYGGYFGGGIGLLMMAALTMAGLAVRNAGASKNILAGVMNASAVAIFISFPDVHWLQAGVVAVGASFGGWAGALMLKTVNEKLLKLGVVAIGVALTIGLFWQAA